jgi:hypothetical protein
MAKTFRSRHKFTNYTNKERFLGRMRTNWRTGVPEPINEPSEWQKYGRDCTTYGVGRKKGYRDLTNEIIRNQNKKSIARIMKDADAWEDMTFADKVDGKVHIWDFW